MYEEALSFAEWYVGMMELHVEDDLNKRPDLCARLGKVRDDFVRWAGVERVSFEADIDDEVETFLNDYLALNTKRKG